MGHKNARWELCILDSFEARGLHWNRHHGCFVIYGRFIADVNHRVEYGNQEDYAVRKYGMTKICIKTDLGCSRCVSQPKIPIRNPASRLAA